MQLIRALPTDVCALLANALVFDFVRYKFYYIIIFRFALLLLLNFSELSILRAFYVLKATNILMCVKKLK